MANLIAKLHSEGFKWGHYTDSGKHACNKDAPMSQGYEHQDARLFALEYKADMYVCIIIYRVSYAFMTTCNYLNGRLYIWSRVKVDACGATIPAQQLMQTWEKELNATGRPILFSNCHNGCQTEKGGSDNDGWQPWCAKLSNMWRSSGDIGATWKGMLKNLDSIKGRGSYAHPGQWCSGGVDFKRSSAGFIPNLSSLNPLSPPPHPAHPLPLHPLTPLSPLP